VSRPYKPSYSGIGGLPDTKLCARPNRRVHRRDGNGARLHSFGVTENLPLPTRIRSWLSERGARFWATTLTVSAVGALFAGSQIARSFDQSVNWYTGFGQWLGALGSFAAAGVALWISVSDRRYNMADRARVERQRETDLQRRAGLVQVTAEMLGRREAVGPSFPAASVGIRNRRPDRIFDIEIVEFIHRGEATNLDIDMVNGFAVFPRRPEHEARFPMKAELRGIALTSDEMLVLYQPDHMPGTPADFVAVEYTDSFGSRWRVATDRSVTRI